VLQRGQRRPGRVASGCRRGSPLQSTDRQRGNDGENDDKDVITVHGETHILQTMDLMASIRFLGSI
jgi:hypothetical protein